MVHVVSNATALRDALAQAAHGAGSVDLRLPEGAVIDLDGLAVVVPPGVSASLSSEGDGATLDAVGRSRVLEVHGGYLMLRRVHLTGGRSQLGNTTISGLAQIGGCLYVRSEQSSVAVVDVHEAFVTNCEAVSDGLEDALGGAMFVDGGLVTLTNTTIANVTCSGTVANVVSGGGVVIEGGNVSLVSSIIANASITAAGMGWAVGGGVCLRSGSLNLINTTIVSASVVHTGSGDAEGGGVFVYRGTVTLTESAIVTSSISVTGSGWATGGGMNVVSGTVTLYDTTITNTSASATSEGGAYGGGLFVYGGTVSLVNTTIADASATCHLARNGQGGGIYNYGGEVLLTAGTALDGNNATGRGATIGSRAGSTTYVLPAPAGRWVSGMRCLVARSPCPIDTVSGYAERNCSYTRDECARIASRTAVVEGVTCQLPTLVQTCDWAAFPAHIGSTFQSLPTGNPDIFVSVDYPYRCTGAIGGVPGSDDTHQSSPQCAGVCPAGNMRGHLNRRLDTSADVCCSWAALDRLLLRWGTTTACLWTRHVLPFWLSQADAVPTDPSDHPSCQHHRPRRLCLQGRLLRGLATAAPKLHALPHLHQLQQSGDDPAHPRRPSGRMAPRLRLARLQAMPKRAHVCWWFDGRGALQRLKQQYLRAGPRGHLLPALPRDDHALFGTHRLALHAM
jgi:hypothetical protein